MDLLVMKFGGSSVSTISKINRTAEKIMDAKNNGHRVIVVVSAMGKTTDQLVSLANELSDSPNKRDMDMLLSTGEQVTISLLSIALREKGCQTVSYTGWQAGILTENIHGNARIIDVKKQKIAEQLALDKIVIVAGFQGMTEDDEITTLGRGGSDTTAVALAAAFKASKCLICTDVPGVFTSDPRYIEKARKLDSVSYDEMLELANLGASVLHPRAVEFAKNYLIPLEVCSSMENIPGTLIEEEVSMEKNLVVRGVAFEDDITRISVFWDSHESMNLASIFTILAAHHVNVDIIIQSLTNHDRTNLSFSIKNNALKETLQVLEENKALLGFEEIEFETGLAKVSIVGSGMISNPGVAAEMFQIIDRNQIQMKMVSTSEIKVSAVVEANEMLKAANALHEAFGLSNEIHEKELSTQPS